ncbi:hypothetical protein H920_01518 [Fukomys damarensis]|uniref:Uncharacterized protein n=1 Tax=Fukomys damarensis TaxID=885580 RepID=A0A091E116_FUKDA|nr:hypothetical protein H920_01518 [Fukomys damarensis]
MKRGWGGGYQNSLDLREQIFQKYPSHQQRCRCVAVAQKSQPSAAVFPWKPPATPLPTLPLQPCATEDPARVRDVMLLAGRESRDLRPSGGANRGRLWMLEIYGFYPERIAKPTCNSSQSTKHSS